MYSQQVSIVFASQILAILTICLTTSVFTSSLATPTANLTANATSPATPATTTTTAASIRSVASVRQLAQAAPYALDNNGNGQGTRNIMFRLNPSQTGSDSKDPWAFMSQNGTIIGTRASFNLKKLLDTLDSYNFTSEVKFDDNLVNITISNFGESEKNNPIDELLLEELLADARWQYGLNGSSVVKDNHRYESKNLRAKPAAIELAITAPPIRSAIEVVAENFTARKIADEANVFAIKLLHQQNIEKLGSRNLIQSPFAIYQGLTLLLSGAMGETAKELDKALLGSQSPYENTKLTHDQDRVRLMASLGDVMRQLYHGTTHHLRTSNESVDRQNNALYPGGTAEQHLIMANNLLFSPSAYEISNEFKNTINSYYNSTALTKIEIGSTESIQVVNSWIRRATLGVIPFVFNKKSTFDEFNVMALLCTSWLAQEWKDTFYKVTSQLRNNIRLKTPNRVARGMSIVREDTNSLLEFVDDNKQSHFVDYIKSRPSKNIHHYQSVLSGMVVDIVAVPFRDSNHRLVVLTPLASSVTNTTHQSPEVVLGQHINSLGIQQQQQQQQQPLSSVPNNTTVDPPDSSLLSRLITSMAGNSRKAMRSIWNIIAPDLITKQTLHNLQLARQKNVTIDTIETSVIPLVQLSIPMIRTEADSSVSAALNHIGIVNSFDPDQANFIGINGHPFNYYKLHLSNVISKTTFNLNEKGINYDKTIKTLESLRIFPNRQQQQDKVENVTLDEDYFKLEIIDEVKLNKPFMYLICDIKTRLVIHTGIVRNPMQEGP